jgi:hypothetical protein
MKKRRSPRPERLDHAKRVISMLKSLQEVCGLTAGQMSRELERDGFYVSRSALYKWMNQKDKYPAGTALLNLEIAVGRLRDRREGKSRYEIIFEKKGLATELRRVLRKKLPEKQ